VRIDHPDGLYDPHQYLQCLQQQYLLRLARRLLGTDLAYQGLADQDLEIFLAREATQASGPQPEELRRPLYVVVEKLLGVHEALKTGRSMAPAAMTFSMSSMGCLWMRRSVAPSLASTATGRKTCTRSPTWSMTPSA
jgi:maltooligosyltrehalose synthase